MLNNGNKTNCGFADEIVSYIYNEMGAPERTKFETHLTHCTACTDEFAAISNARFSVFEWQKEEFAHLATPQIVIPYPAKQRIVEENTSIGVSAGIRGWLSLVNFPVTVAAALAVCIGLGFVAINYLGSGDQRTVANVDLPAVVTPAPEVKIGSTGVATPPAPRKTEVEITTAASKNVASVRESRPVKAIENRRMRPDKQTEADAIRVQNPMRKLRKAPVLSPYDDNDDRSLRLADLFDEDGG